MERTVHFKKLNELLAAMYFTAAFALICQNMAELKVMIVCLVISLMYGVYLRCFKTALLCLPAAVLMAVLNPLFYHTGVTPLFYVNDLPYTLEALLRGLSSAAMMETLILWFSAAVKCIDTERLFELFSKIMPTVSLMLSMIFKSFGDIKRRLGEISACQSGFLSDSKNIFTKIRQRSGIFLAVCQSSLEGSVIKGMSMNARGFSNRKKTSVYRFRVRADDIIVFLTAFALAAAGFYFGLAEALYLMLLVPLAYKIKEEIKWRYLKSKI